MCRNIQRCVALVIVFIALQLHTALMAAESLTSRFVRLDIQHGLSQATVTAIAQDGSGNIWIGTQNGLNRYDGFSVKVFQPDEQQHTVSDNFVTSLAIDNQEQLWIGTLNGLNRFTPSTATFADIALVSGRQRLDNAIISLHLDNQQRLWAGTERGPALLNATGNMLLSWPQQAPSEHIFQQQNITALTTDNSGHLWLGTPRGLFCVEISSGNVIEIADYPYPDASVMALLYDEAGRLWVGLENEGLIMREANSSAWTQITLASYNNGITSKEIRSIKLSQNGNLWVGTQHGLNQLQLSEGLWQQKASYYHQRNNKTSLGSGKVIALLEDNDNSLWVGTWNGGVSRLHQASNLFTSITPDLPLMAAARNPATITLASLEQRVWAGTADGLFSMNLPGAEFNPVGDPQESVTFYSTLKRADSILFGHSNGIKKLNTNIGEYRDEDLPAGLPAGPVRRMLDTPEHLWLAIDQFGIVLLTPGLQHIVKRHAFSRSITFIKPLKQFVLVGSYDGLSWFDASSGELLFNHAIDTVLDSDLSKLTFAPMDYVQTDGKHWLATNGGGLIELIIPTTFDDPARVEFKAYTDPQGLVSKQLKAAETDNTGNIWFSTSSGIAVFLPKSGSFRNFSAYHGTLSRDYINAASCKLGNGDIVFGGMDGFTLFNPEHVLAYQAPDIATPHIKEIHVNGAPLQLDALSSDATLAKVLHSDKRLTIPASGSRGVSFKFSTREYIESQQVQFQYRLDPLSSSWTTKDSDNRTAAFERLPPGTYLLRLRAGLPQSGWSEEQQLTVEVLPLWWETWLARSIILTLVACLLFSLHALRLRQMHRRQEELAWLVEERTNALNERSKALEESKNRAEQTVQQLASTMKELVRTEKMAALGQLVAGVAHEVNTPLGVALTASSIVNEESLQLTNRLASGNIRRTELTEYLNKLTQATQLLNTNLQRAAHLVMNFKQVSVDRTADNQRQFNLAEYIDELLESLRLMWRSRQINIKVSCPDNIVMDSYPGTVAQIITNFCQNALLHAFKDHAVGHITISCCQRDKLVEIVFADDGIGISKENLERIFDPFFTTSRHQGGTGLGLHIVYNLVTQKLRGNISVSSTEGQGTQFTLLLPLNVYDS
ncbi:ATP-binding protein [Rheinheimera baltica]|uniref:histidine kinase n=1 Tax=Rheinheimera baltica TaxID=67576 RepID=A0ABT9I4Q0_9GAMM|nr:sensor histidine kinase [Rheinheimera baltica]MDP5138386.1 ATP-binding protein [Rheinheimera baltica]